MTGPKTGGRSPIPPDYGRTFNSPNETFSAPDAGFDIRPPVNPRAIIEQRPLSEKMYNANQILIFYGRIIYEDVLGKERHETRWCYSWQPNERQFIKTGPDGDGYKEYNRYT
jgi:hypothetical protein